MEQIIIFTLLAAVIVFCLYYFFFRVYFRGEKGVREEEGENIPELVTEKRGLLFFTLPKSKKEEREKRERGTMYFTIAALENPEQAKKILSEANPKCFDFQTLLKGKESSLVCEILLEHFRDNLTCDDLIYFEEMVEDFKGIPENNLRLKELAVFTRLERFPKSFKPKELFNTLGGFGGYSYSVRPSEKMTQLARKALLSFPKEKFEFKDLWDYELARSAETGIKHEIAREIILQYFVNAENLKTMFSDWYGGYRNEKNEEQKSLLNVFFEALLFEADRQDCRGIFEILNNSFGLFAVSEGILMRLMEKRGQDFDLWTLLNLSSRESTQIFKNKIYELALSLSKESVEYKVIKTHTTSLNPDKELIKKLLEKYFPGMEESKKMSGKEFAEKYELTKCEVV